MKKKKRHVHAVIIGGICWLAIAQRSFLCVVYYCHLFLILLLRVHYIIIHLQVLWMVGHPKSFMHHCMHFFLSWPQSKSQRQREYRDVVKRNAVKMMARIQLEAIFIGHLLRRVTKKKPSPRRHQSFRSSRTPKKTLCSMWE